MIAVQPKTKAKALRVASHLIFCSISVLQRIEGRDGEEMRESVRMSVRMSEGRQVASLFEGLILCHPIKSFPVKERF